MIMTQEGLATTHSQQRKESPLGLFIAVIRDHPDATEREHRRLFKEMVKSEGFDDYLDALIGEWEGLKYGYALRAAQPPSPAEIREKAQARKQEASAAEQRKQKAKSTIGARILDLTTPNGKTLRACTGAECVALGSFYAVIGKNVPAKKTVGEVLTERKVASLWKQTDA